MAFTTEPIEAPPPGTATKGPSEFDLGFKEFVGYDPKGTKSVTGDPLTKPDNKNTQQPEIVKAEESPKPEESVTLSPKISALARKEQATRQRELALKQKEEAFAAKLQDAEKYSQLKEKIAAKDFSAANELGLTYEEHLKYETDKLAKADPGEERVRKLEEEMQSFKKAQEENEIKEYQYNQSLWAAEIARVVAENPEFSTIKELKAQKAVLDHINDSFNEDGIELTAEQAAKEIEDALVLRAERFANVSKVKNKSEAGKVLGPPQKSTKTITQNMTTTPVKSASKPFHLMSESEQLAEAIRRVNAAKLQR